MNDTRVSPFMYSEQDNPEYAQIPARVEVIPIDVDGVEQLNGGYSRQLQDFKCEICGYKSSRFSMFAMIFNDSGDFATRKATEDEIHVIATRMLANTGFEQWNPGYSQKQYEAWWEEHKEEQVTKVNPDTIKDTDTLEHRALLCTIFKNNAIAHQNQLMMDAVKIQGKSISRACLFCCVYIHQVA